MNDETADLRREMERTRAHMSDTVAELDARLSAKTRAAKERTDVVGMIRANPWTALALALGAGVALAATGSDRRVVRAAGSAAKRAPGAALDAARQLVHRGDEKGDDDAAAAEGAARQRDEETAGLIGRFTGALKQSAAELVGDMRREADGIVK